MYELHNYRFQMLLRNNGDVWGLCGYIHGRPYVDSTKISMVSPPVAMDGDVITTLKGSQYRLINPCGDERKIREGIETVIRNGGYEIK